MRRFLERQPVAKDAAAAKKAEESKKSSAEEASLQAPPQETAASQVAAKVVGSHSPSVVPVTAGGSCKGTTAPQPEPQRVAAAPSVSTGAVPKVAASATSEIVSSIEGVAAQSSPSLGTAEAEESKY